jgi:hypothetical protein
MSVFFSGGKTVDMAMGTEKNGITYRTTPTEKTSHTNIEFFYTYLPDDEIKHPMSFRNRTDTAGSNEGVEPNSDTYLQYLKSFIDIAAVRRLAENAVSEYNAVNTARKDYTRQIS